MAITLNQKRGVIFARRVTHQRTQAPGMVDQGLEILA